MFLCCVQINTHFVIRVGFNESTEIEPNIKLVQKALELIEDAGLSVN